MTRMTVRFDDSLATVLSADTRSDIGAQSAWRQLVDLIGRGRAPADAPGMARLRALREAVPLAVREASARMLAEADPPTALVAMFAEDAPSVAAPVLRAARLPDADWLALLPRLDPRARSLLRHRRDLSDAVERGLASFGAADFVLSDDRTDVQPALPELEPQPELEPEAAQAADDAAGSAPATFPLFRPDPDTPLSETPFQRLGAVAQALPFVAEARRRAEVPVTPRFEIAELVARIDAFQRDRPAPPPPSEPAPVLAAVPDADPAMLSFEYETDEAGVIRWVEGVARPALVGMSLATNGTRGLARLDAVAAGALTRRQGFTDARLEIGGSSTAAGSWRLSGAPLFDFASGRFTGMRGIGRRPRRDEQAERRAPAADSLRQLVHELRTPANAIMGFAELIGTEMMGPVPDHYRDRADVIRDQAVALVAAIEDLDVAARIEGQALELRPGEIGMAALVGRVLADLRPLAALRQVTVQTRALPATLAIAADERATERLVSRLLAAIVSAGSAGETITIGAAREDTMAILVIDGPGALASDEDSTLFRIDAGEAEAPGAPLLGIGFTLRLARNLARELGGELARAPGRLLLRLPAAAAPGIGQAEAI